MRDRALINQLHPWGQLDRHALENRFAKLNHDGREHSTLIFSIPILGYPTFSRLRESKFYLSPDRQRDFSASLAQNYDKPC
jgi:hypothetical protein